MPVLKLTQNYIAHELKCPNGKNRIEYCDQDLPGLYVAVRQKTPGRGTYYLRYKNTSGKTTHKKIGRTTEINLSDARKKAKELKAEIALGGEPTTEKTAARLTFTDFFDRHHLPYVKPRKRSWRKDQDYYRLRLKARFGQKRLGEITRQEIQAFHSDLLEQGFAPATCDHHVKLIRYALNLALEWEMIEKNPARKVPLFNVDNKVENYLSPEELERLLVVLNTNHNRMVCNIALFLLSTGARLQEAMRAKWEEIDQKNRLWRIPAANSKSKRVRSVPLNDSALEILERLGTRDEYDNLFFNRQTGKHYVGIHGTWKCLREEAGLPHLRLHDLRHQFASFLVNSGRTLYEVQHILGHSAPIVTQRYAHLSTKTLQDAANSASRIIKEASSA